MQETQYTRKLDGTGRLVVPVKLREMLKMSEGDEYTFFIHEIGTQKFLCVECYNAEDKITKAKRILREAGITSLDDDE